MSKPLQFFEYQKVAYKGKWQHKEFKRNHHEAFESYYTRNPENPFFELIPYGVRFKQYVGAIQIGKTTIEVLPKVSGDEEKKDIWQKVLIDMLKTCKLLTAKQTGEAQLTLKANSVIELYFELFISEVEQLCHKGLIKKYRSKTGNQNTVKGAIQFSRNIANNTVHKERFYLNYTEYTKDHLLHQILYKALKVIDYISNSPLLKDKIKRLKTIFPEVSQLEVSKRHFDRITASRKHQPYEKAVNIAELILMSYRPDIKAGRKDLLAIMFDMNILWEEYIFRLLKKTQSKDFEILAQRKKLFWGESQKIKPDIVLISKETNETFIIDTKWKVVSKNRPSDDDLKQMYVYNHHWSSRRSVLLYPNAGNQLSISGLFALDLKEDISHSCQIAFVNVINNSGLNENLASEIFSLLEV